MRPVLGEIMNTMAQPQQQGQPPPPGFGMRKAKTFSVYRDIPGNLQSSENVPPAVTAHAQPTLTRAASSVAGAAPTPLLLQPAASRAPSVPSFAIYNDENSAPIQQNAVQRSAFWAEKSAKPNFVIHTDEEIETTTTTASTAHASCSATLAQAAASLATSAATRERVPLGTLPMPRPVIKDDAEDEFGPVEMADASSTSVHMSEDSEVDEDDEYSELDGVELYKGSSAAAS